MESIPMARRRPEIISGGGVVYYLLKANIGVR